MIIIMFCYGRSANQKKLRDKGRDGESRYSSLLDVIVGCGDMVLLDPPNEDKVVENLKLRYSKKDIYVRKYIARASIWETTEIVYEILPI